MKYIIIFTLILCTIPSFASVNCIDNSQHLAKPYDDKEWHSVACDCPCEIIKNGRCTECGHLQDAHPLTIIEPSRMQKVVTKQLAIQEPKTLKDFFNNSVVPYLQNR